MDYSLTFARHFSRLVWLLLNEPDAIDEQKAALRALVTVAKEGPVTFTARDWRVTVNGELLPEALTGVPELAAQLIGHAVRELAVDRSAVAADLLGVARILAREPVPGDGGEAVIAKLDALGARTVHVAVQGQDGLMRGPTSAPAASDAADDLGLPDVIAESDKPPAPAPSPAPTPEPAAATRSAPTPAPPSGEFLAFGAVTAIKGSTSELLAQLDATTSVSGTTRLLDQLVTIAENAQREGRSDAVAEVFHSVVDRETRLPEGELKRAFVMAVRRMAKPTLLRAVAQMLPRRQSHREQYVAVLARAGEDGADALIEQLANAQAAAERRIYFDALVALNAGVPALLHMLGDPRWFVARNAADLLGELKAADAEGPLAEAVRHDDDRVRRSAVSALGKIGTPKAIDALGAALSDTSPQVREQAVIGLAARKGGRVSTSLVKALDEETDAEVQHAILAALGRIATPDAIQKLIKAAEPEGRLFKKKSSAYRVAAVQALSEAKSPAALNALQALTSDKDKEVREAVFRSFVATQPPKAGTSR